MTYGRRAALACMWLTAAIAALALFGWHVQSRVLSGFSTSYIPMAPNTALCFLLLSFALLLTDSPSTRKRLVARVLTLPVIAIAFLRLVEIIAGAELQVDRWIFNPTTEFFHNVPLAHMAFFTAVNFLVHGVAVFLLTLRTDRRSTENIAGLLAVVAGLVGLAFCIGYLTGTPLLYNSGVIPMALNTAITFVTLGASLGLRLLVKDLERQLREGRKPALEVDRKILAGFGSALAAVFVVSILSYHNTLQAISSTRLVAHSHEVLAEVQATFSAVRDVESAARGFVLTEDGRLLQDFHAAVQRTEQHLQHLRILVADNPLQGRRVDSLQSLVQKKVALSQQNINLCLTQGPRAAREQIRRGEGIALMSEINTIIQGFSAHENTLLTERHSAQERNSRNTVGTFVMLVALVVLILAAIYLVVHRDLVGRQRAEEELRRASERIHDLYNNAPCGYHSLNTDGVIVAINDTELRWLGYSRDEVVGKMHITQVLTPASAEHFRQNFPIFKERGSIENVELEFRRKDGTTFIGVINASAINDEQGRYLSSRSTLFDVTERKRVEMLFQNLLEAAPDAIVIVDADGRIKLMSKQVEEMFGYRREELLGKEVEVLIPRRLRDRHPQHRMSFLQNPHVRPMGAGLELFALRKDGTEFPVEISLGPLGSGRDILISAAIRDITARKEIEHRIMSLNRDLERRAAELVAANRELEAFSYSVSHDLRAPLRHIDGFVELLQQYAGDRLDEKARRYVRIISESAKQMGQLIDDLLVFSRVGRTEMFRTIVPLSSLVREVQASLQHECRGRIIEWSIGPLPDVHGDPSMLRQVFSNLLSNAIKYTRPAEHARIEVGTLHQNNSDEHVIYVRDNGVGFDMKYRDKLFGVFQRLHTDREFEGTGIGLANVRRIIARHGGRTWAEGEVGKGATFYFSLPKEPDGIATRQTTLSVTHPEEGRS
ncbi:MAG TPA: PAS domain S-box protein [Bacteroidota bacterium]|nr:PAS domain S-box protein [Bacteroidota bacterium]